MKKYPSFRRICIAICLVTALGIALAALVAAPYFLQFSSGLSAINSDWGDFGSYFGGVVGPLVAFLSFLALVVTLLLQYSSLLETRREVEQNSHANARSDFLRRFEIEERSLEILSIDIVKALLLYILKFDDEEKGKSQFNEMLHSYSNGERNVFFNFLKGFMIVDGNQERVSKLFSYADSAYGAPLEQYVHRFDAMLKEARAQGIDVYELVRWRASAKLFDVVEMRYKQELHRRGLS